MFKIISLILFIICILLLSLLIKTNSYIEKLKKECSSLSIIFKKISRLAESVRYGNLTERLDPTISKSSRTLFINLNNMIEALEDREKMIKEYQQDLNERNQNLEEVFDSFIDGLILVNDKGIVLRSNKSAEKTLNLSAKKLKKKPIEKLFLTEEFEPFTMAEVKINLIENNLFEIVSFEDKEAIFSASVAKITIKEENRYLIEFKDITEQRNIEKVKQDFIATLTHDLKVPVLAESNALKFFLDGSFGELNSKQTEALGNMQNSNNELIELLNNLLDVYKYDAGAIEINKEPTNISALLKECIKELEPLAKKCEHNLSLKAHEDIPTNIKLDKKDIKRVIRNLLHNAITYTQKEGDIKIELSSTKDNVVIKIEDNGKGIVKEDLDKIFDRYYSSAKKFRKVGTGLGLYLSKKIVEDHKGKIWAESELDKGSIFYIKLPI